MQKPSLERVAELNQGFSETKNLMEALAIDFGKLIHCAYSDFNISEFPPKTGITKKMQLVAQWLYEREGWDAFDVLCSHSSDTLRGIACYMIAHYPQSLEEKFTHIKPLAADKHFGVREWAWLALRQDVIAQLDPSLELLASWSRESCENIRRFASEVTRPRGVWCAHITALRKEPWKALKILESLHNDPARYVQLSVGNWLNDAGKDHGEWVLGLCDAWQKQSSSLNTVKICNRALRNLK